MEKIVHIAAHECYHRQEYKVIEGIELLQEAGIDCENIECFAEAVALKQARDNYYMDSLSYESYSENLLEERSEEYADKMVKDLKAKGYLE